MDITYLFPAERVEAFRSFFVVVASSRCIAFKGRPFDWPGTEREVRECTQDVRFASRYRTSLITVMEHDVAEALTEADVF